MLRLLTVLLLSATTINAQDSLLKEFVPVLPHESVLTFSQWKSDSQNISLRGSTKAFIPNAEGCDREQPGNGTILISYDFYNIQTEFGRARMLSESNYVNEVYTQIKSEMMEGIEAEKRSREYMDFSKLNEEDLGEGKVYYYTRKVSCTALKAKYNYVTYTAYLPVRSGFLHIDLNYYGSIERVKTYIKEMYINIKNLDEYNFFSKR